MTGTRPTLVLLDGHSLAYRAFYAIPDTLRTSTGQLTNAVFGFTSMLIKLLGDRDPDAIAVVFDAGRDVARTAAYPEYKAGRPETPDEFRPQLDLIREVLDALGIPVLEVPGVEADDVIATIARRAVDAGYDVLIVTGDRDAMQLVDDHTTVLYTARGVTELREMTPAAVRERYGIDPAQYVDYAALRGDPSDNLPGVPGVGEKTAAELLRRYGDLDGILAHLDDIGRPKLRAALAEHAEQVRTHRELIRLRRDVDLEVDLETLRRRPPDREAVGQLFTTLEFRTLRDRLWELLGAPEAAEFQLEPERLEATQLAGWLAGAAPPLAVAAGTEGQPPRVRWRTVGLADQRRAPVAAALGTEAPPALGELLADPDRPLVVHDLKRLDHAAHGCGWRIAGVVMDTELAAYLMDPDQRTYDLDTIARQYCGRGLPSTEVVADGQLPLETDLVDEARRAAATLEVARVLEQRLAERGQMELLRTIELPLVGVLARMERTGIAVDPTVLDDIRTRLRRRLEELEHEIWRLAGHEFNIASAQQLQRVLFEELGLPKTRRIKTGYSTDAQALASLVGAHPIVQAILDWREISKLLTTYVDALPPLIDPETGRIHTTFSQTAAATGRLSSANPNLQNIPVRGELGREIRRAFVPGPGYDRLLVADYSQIELRILAHLCRDEGLLQAFRRGEDIHTTTAARVFDLPPAQVDAALRDRAKAVNYGLAYGLSAYGLGQQLGIPPEEAQTIVDAYTARFPRVMAFLREVVERARRDGYTTTLFGRRRYLPDLHSDNRNRRAMAERMALNAPIQGTAADIIKLAMVRVQRALDDAGVRSRLVLQVHDELVLEVPADELDAVRSMVVAEMSGVAELAVPLEVDTADGPTWYDARKH